MFLRTLASLALSASVVALAGGCSTSAEIDPGRLSSDDRSSSQSEQAQLAAYAARAEYPIDAQASDDLQAAAILDRQNGTIEIWNFSDRALQNVNVWVNGSFVHQVSSIPANGRVTLQRSEFFDRSGTTLAATNTTINRVQLQSGEQIYNVQGPALR